MTCEEAGQALGLLVLGALEPGEAVAVNEHLADCGVCSAEMRQLAQVVKILPYGMPEVAPPGALEKRLLSRIQPAGRRAAGRWTTPGWPAWAPAAAAAALIIGLGSVMADGLLLQRQQAVQANLEASTRRDQADRAALASLAGGSGRSLGLHATPMGAGAYGVLRMDPSTGQVVLVAYGLRPAPAGRAYQGWLHRGPERISIGVFAATGGGEAVVVTLSGQPASLLGEVDGFGVTLEPLGGSPGPTTPPVIVS
ncbi:MAG: hypothetical protein NVS9B1_17750 [Candidatus Dormibacteraceae bacterium]